MAEQYIEDFARRVLGDEEYGNGPCQAHPLEIVEMEIERLREQLGAYEAAQANDPTAWPAIIERDRLRAEVEEWKQRAQLMREHIPSQIWPLVVATYPEVVEWFTCENADTLRGEGE